jgi:hypothetical protein
MQSCLVTNRVWGVYNGNQPNPKNPSHRRTWSEGVLFSIPDKTAADWNQYEAIDKKNISAEVNRKAATLISRHINDIIQLDIQTSKAILGPDLSRSNV